MREILAIVIMLEVISISAASAQGTHEQRRACKDDAYKFCPYDVPNPEKQKLVSESIFVR